MSAAVLFVICPEKKRTNPVTFLATSTGRLFDMPAAARDDVMMVSTVGGSPVPRVNSKRFKNTFEFATQLPIPPLAQTADSAVERRVESTDRVFFSS
jgi:hypothetical protein